MASATEIAERLRFLERENGRLIPSDVVEDARDPASLLHEQFEWNNDEAADRYRIQQASRLIRTVRIDITVREVPLRAPAYVRDPNLDTRDAGYRNLIQLRSEEDVARAAVVNEMKRVSQAVKRAKILAAALGFVNEIDTIHDLAQSIIGRTQNISDQPGGEA